METTDEEKRLKKIQMMEFDHKVIQDNVSRAKDNIEIFRKEVQKWKNLKEAYEAAESKDNIKVADANIDIFSTKQSELEELYLEYREMEMDKRKELELEKDSSFQ